MKNSTPRSFGETIQVRRGVADAYPDVLTGEVGAAIAALAPLNENRRDLMRARIERRAARARDRQRLTFLDPESLIGGTSLKVADARAGRFEGSDIPEDLRRQWIQGTGPATRPHASPDHALRNLSLIHI